VVQPGDEESKHALGEPVGESAVEVQSVRELRGDEEGLIVKFKRQVGEHFGVTKHAVGHWKRAGMPVTEDGQYDLDAIEIWRASSVQMKKADQKKDEKIKRDVMALRMNTKMAVPEIAEKVGLAVYATKKITDLVDKYKPELEHFKANKADYFTLEQMRYLDHITDKKLESTPARDLRAMAKTAWEQERVERGESVDNVAVIVKHIRELKAQEDA
jgi:hypothetical protein